MIDIPRKPSGTMYLGSKDSADPLKAHMDRLAQKLSLAGDDGKAEFEKKYLGAARRALGEERGSVIEVLAPLILSGRRDESVFPLYEIREFFSAVDEAREYFEKFPAVRAGYPAIFRFNSVLCMFERLATAMMDQAGNMEIIDSVSEASRKVRELGGLPPEWFGIPLMIGNIHGRLQNENLDSVVRESVLRQVAALKSQPPLEAPNRLPLTKDAFEELTFDRSIFGDDVLRADFARSDELILTGARIMVEELNHLWHNAEYDETQKTWETIWDLENMIAGTGGFANIDHDAFARRFIDMADVVRQRAQSIDNATSEPIISHTPEMEELFTLAGILRDVSSMAAGGMAVRGLIDLAREPGISSFDRVYMTWRLKDFLDTETHRSLREEMKTMIDVQFALPNKTCSSSSPQNEFLAKIFADIFSGNSALGATVFMHGMDEDAKASSFLPERTLYRRMLRERENWRRTIRDIHSSPQEAKTAIDRMKMLGLPPSNRDIGLLEKINVVSQMAGGLAVGASFTDTVFSMSGYWKTVSPSISVALRAFQISKIL